MLFYWLQLQFFVLYSLDLQMLTFALNMSNKDDNRFHYLSRQRPLWVLEDQVSSMERYISNIKLTTTAKPHYPTYYLKYRRKKTIPQVEYFERTLPNPPMQVNLPRHYIYPSQKNYSWNSYRRQPEAYTYWRRQQPLSIPLKTESYAPSMPTFDSVPNDIDATDDVLEPIFVYNGPKGELIMNTMLSTQKYPMQEPIPGETLYPPIAPIFRPKPIVQRFRISDHDETMNLTLIPFYAHEAIVPRFLYTTDSMNSAEVAESTSLSSSSAVIYAAPAPPRSSSTTISTTTTSTTSKPTKKRRHKKTKHYAVYRSPEEVYWRPTEPTLQRYSEVTTSYPMVLANPLQNHRFSENKIDLTTTLKPLTNFKLTYKDDDANFQIVYVDESLEKPIIQEIMPTRSPSKRLRNTSTPNPLPVLSSHYSTEKEYYAFPVYTLGKLLKPDTSVKPKLYSSHIPHYEIQKKNSEKNVDTWFIMNSRYKGHRTKDGSKRLSSKYVEVQPAARTAELLQESAETTLETSLLRK